MIQVLNTHLDHEGLFDKILHGVLLESLFETLKLIKTYEEYKELVEKI